MPHGLRTTLTPLMRAGSVALALVAVTTAASSQQPAADDWSSVEQTLGRKGASQAGGVMRFAFPRTDLRVTAAGVAIRPAGDRATLARVIRSALASTKTPLDTSAQPASSAANQPFDLDTAPIASTLGTRGRVNGGVYQVNVPRAETIREVGLDEPSRTRVVPPAMGLGTVINFQPTGSGRAAITGDFVMTAREVNRVIRALREHGIEITSLHNHLLSDEPRLFFSDEGALIAAFDGMHGWFWRNRGQEVVTVTLRTSGQYQELKRM